jgi:hypothetical protein
MTQDQLKNKELDELVHNALATNADLIIPPGLSDRTIRKLEKKVLLRQLILELFFKFGLILGSLAILAVVFVWINRGTILTGLFSYFIDNWQTITALFLLVFITVFIDQVGLKFYTTFKKEISLNT